MFDNKRLLVVVAHPDDEVLGVGGTINKLVTQNDCLVKVVILGEGITSRDTERNVNSRARDLENHRDCIAKAQRKLGYQYLSVYNLPDNRFDSVDLLSIIKIIEHEKNDFKPDYIFTHHSSDLNIDHRKTFEAVLTCTRPLPGESVKGVFCFETFSSTEWSYSLDPLGFRPTLSVCFNFENLTNKIKAMECYSFEVRDFPHPRSSKSLEAFAVANGSKVGKEYAENFEVVRFLV